MVETQGKSSVLRGPFAYGPIGDTGSNDNLAGLRAQANSDEFAEAERRAAMVAGGDDLVAALAGRVGRSLVEAGLNLHHCEPGDPMYRLGGICLLAVEARPGENPKES